jgi:CHASE3 domain sensor protein
LESLNEHIKLINAKLQQLLKQYEALQVENKKQKETIDVLQKEELNLKTKLGTIQQQHLLLKAASAPLNTEDKKELEQKINVYLRNIDKCISLLSQ